MLQRAIVHRFGPPQEVVALRPYTLPSLESHEVRVRMLASPINPSDLITITGQYQMRIALPFVPGFEGVGYVEEVGSAVKQLRQGMRVLPIGSAGMWQSVKTVAADWCEVVPERLSDIDAATSFVNPITAWLMLFEEGRLAPGMRIFINGAGSSIGRMLIRMANHAGVSPIISTRYSTSLNPAQEGMQIMQHLIGEHGDHRNLRELDIVLDCVGGDVGCQLKCGLRHGGIYLHYGLLSGQALPQQFWWLRLDVRYIAFHMRHWLHKAPVQTRHAVFKRVMAWVTDGIARTDHWQSCAFETLPEQLEHIASGAAQEKRILLFDR